MILLNNKGTPWSAFVILFGFKLFKKVIIF